MSEAFLRTLDEAFNTRELLKVKVLDNAPDHARDSADQIVERTNGIQIAQTIGRTIVLYRGFPEEPEIVFPK